MPALTHEVDQRELTGMKGQQQIRRAGGIVILILGSGMAVSSCAPNILRNGNEPVAGLISLVGLVALWLGWALCRTESEPSSETARTWMCLGLENFALISLC